MKCVQLNLNECVWLREALRAYVTSKQFDNDPVNVAAMGVLITKIAVASNSNLKGEPCA